MSDSTHDGIGVTGRIDPTARYPDRITPPTRHLFGCDFVTGVDIDELVELLIDLPDDDRRSWSCTVTPNVDHLVRYDAHPDEYEVARHATLLLPDGMPIVWASRWLDEPLERRLAGSDLFAGLWPRLAAADTPTVVVASNDEVAGRLAAEHPGARCIVPPMFDVSDEVAVEQLVDRIVETCAEIDAWYLFIGVSMPKHHLLAARLRERWAGQVSPHVLLLGASADFYLGISKRAPEWMQRSGTEWLHRLASDPRRMARRYLIDDPHFVRLVWRERRARRRSAPAGAGAGVRR